MDKRWAGGLAAGLALGAVLGALGSRAGDAQGRTTARTELVTLGLSECADKEVRMYTTEIGPGVITPRHAHPGVYLVYVLEGSGTLERDDKPPLELRPGVSYAIDGTASAPTWHTVWNTDRETPLKSLAILITGSGRPGTLYDR